MSNTTQAVSTLSVFNFQENPVRVEANNGEPLFCLKDVADILDIKNAKSSRFKLKEAGVHKMYVSHESGKKLTTFINEPNLYRVIFRSNKDEAVIFQDWVFEEVLPQIRKTGSYTQYISTEQAGELYTIVHARAGDNGKLIPQIWSRLKNHFGYFASYREMKATDFDAAKTYLLNMDVQGAKKYTPTKEDIFSEAHSEVVDYLWSLYEEIKRLGGTVPAQPKFDSQAICNAYIRDAITFDRLMLSFDTKGEAQVRVLSRDKQIMADSDMAARIKDPFAVDKKHLSDIAQAVFGRLGKLID